MYRNCLWKKCNYNNNCNNDVLEDICDNVSDENYENDMHNNCSCGFDEDISPFTDYPMYGHSYVPVQTINKTFTPCARTKNGNNISRTSKPI